MDINLAAQIQQCAPGMDARLITSLIRHESNFNPYAIGLDGKAVLKPQPRNLDEAITAVDKLTHDGKTFSVGLAQIHISNVRSFGMKWWQAFDACTSLHYAQVVYQDFYAKAVKAGFKDSDAVFAALRGYNSGNIFAPVSNDYASTIMTVAAAYGSLPLQPIRLALNAPGNIPQQQEARDDESLELFDK